MVKRHTTTSSSGSNSYIEDGNEPLADKKTRVRQELADAGATAYGLSKFNSRYLPTIIHDDEHIKGVIYGRFTEGPGLLSWADRMVVATDIRVISLNHKPGYTDIDEFTYDMIDGIDSSTVLRFTAVTLNTKISHFTVRFVNVHCAEVFVHNIELKRLEYFAAASKAVTASTRA